MRTSHAENIGPKERKKRFAIATAMLGLSVGIFAVLMVAGVNPLWRLGLFLPVWMGALGFFQAEEKT